MQIGSINLDNNLVLAPMAGVTDKPFRQLCRQLSAGLVVSEMVTANTELWHTRKSRLRLDHSGEVSPCSVQITGADPQTMALAAKMNVDRGADIIDINMGCPAKKVCGVMAGSALLKDEIKVARILSAVVNAVSVPVTLKIRTGWDQQNKNATKIARIAEDSGIQMLAIHGRTRACAFNGTAEYETVAEVKSLVKIPVIANGDINSPQQAVMVMKATGVDGIMIGRAAQGNPWIFREILHYLETGMLLPPPSLTEIKNTLVCHLHNLYKFYGEFLGVRIARKHIGWYCKHQDNSRIFRSRINQAESISAQLDIIEKYFGSQLQQEMAA